MVDILNLKLKQRLWIYIEGRIVSGEVIKKETTEFLLYNDEESAIGYITIALDDFPRTFIRDHPYNFFYSEKELLKWKEAKIITFY